MKKILTILFSTMMIVWFSFWTSMAEDIKLSTNRESPSMNQYVNLTIETDEDYVGKLSFSAKYRSSSSSSRTNISNLTSSTYFSDYSDDWDVGYYRMRSADDGEVTLKNLVKFKKKWYYRIYVKDTDWDQDYIQFSVGGDSSSNSDLKASASPYNPNTNERIKLTIETDDDYVGKINFTKLQYRSSTSSSWSNVWRTSSTYVSDYSTEWSNWYYKMTSSDDGEKTISKLIKFKKKWYYRIYVEDVDWNETHAIVIVDGSSSSSSDDDIELSTNRKSPSTSQYVNLTIETDDDYTWKLTFSAKYRSSSSSSWTNISNLTSSTYFSDYSDDWDVGYYRMRSSDDGEITLKNLVKFKKKGYYRIYVKDTDWNENYIQFSVGTSSDDDEDDNDDEYDIAWFTSDWISRVKNVYKGWNSMIGQMQRRYPSLKKDYYWNRISENFYEDMKDVVNNKKVRDFNDYEDFKDAFDDWYEYTMRKI